MHQPHLNPVLWMHNALSSWNLSFAPSLSYSYLVLKQVFIVISQELSMACFFFNWFGEKCAHGTNSFETLHQIVIWGHIKYITKPKKEGSTSVQAPSLWDSNCSGLFEVPTKIACAKICNGLWCATTFLEIASAKMGVLSVCLEKFIFTCVILGVSGGVQLHT